MPTLTRLYVESIGGVAGDMLLGALIDIGADVAAIEGGFASLGIPGLGLSVESVTVDGIDGCYVRSMSPDPEHKHHHLSDIFALIERADIPDAARRRARAIFDIIAEAEAEVHGGRAGDVHLHEVGEIDSIMDVLGIAVAIDSLSNPSCTAAPLPSGRGQVETSHGWLDCPVPAVVEVARRFAVPLQPAEVTGETVTPTGIAAIAQMCTASGDAARGLSRFRQGSHDGHSAIGVGVGTRRFDSRPNIVRLYGWR